MNEHERAVEQPEENPHELPDDAAAERPAAQPERDGNEAEQAMADAYAQSPTADAIGRRPTGHDER